MGSHLGAIGFPPGPLREQVEPLLDLGHELGTADGGARRVVAYQDPSGSRVVVTFQGGAVTCLTPTFAPGQRLRMVVDTLGANTCPYERPVVGDVLDSLSLPVYPLAVQIEDLALTADRFGGRPEVELDVAALAEAIEVFPDEAAYHATEPTMASESLIPSGLFTPPGAEDPDDAEPEPRVLMTGIVLSTDLRRHSILGGEFVRMTVRSFGAAFEVLADAADLRDGTGSIAIPPVGAVIKGSFWLSGRLASPAS